MLLALLVGATHASDEFNIHPDFKITRIAAEPAIWDPVDMAWDEQGRLYVLQMSGYPTPESSTRPWPGKIMLLDDKDGDGFYESSRVFADDFLYADSIVCWRGGVIVANTPELLFLKDTDGDGVADEREVLLTGFMVGNAQHNFNGLAWCLDNRLIMSNGGNSGRVRLPDDANIIAIEGHDLWFDPAKKTVELTGESSGGFGVALDNWGHVFTTHNTDHISTLVFPQRYVDRNPHVSPGGTLQSISDHSEGGLARVFPSGPAETRVNHPEQSGYFSGACGITFYGGGAFGPEFENSIFIGDVVTNLVHRDVIRANGPSFLAGRAADEQRSEFFSTSDRWFRPVNLKTGPDGALYLMDFHRAVIEHPEWIPDELEKDMNVREGDTMGRIYRITPKGGLPGVKVDFRKEHPETVVAALASPNKWMRDTAQRVLVEWQLPESVSMIERIFATTHSALGRLHALWTLEGLGRLREPLILRALAGAEPGLRENAIIISESRLAESEALREAVLELLGDSDSRVRLQAILSLGELLYLKNEVIYGPVLKSFKTVAASDDANNHWMRVALISGLGNHPREIFESLAGRVSAGENFDDGRRNMLHWTSRIIGARKAEDESTFALTAISAEGWDAGLRITVLDGLYNGLREGDAAPWMSAAKPEIEAVLAPLMVSDDPSMLSAVWSLGSVLHLDAGESRAAALDRARSLVADAAADPSVRIENLSLLEFAPYEEREELLFGLLDIQHPTELQIAAMEQLSRAPNERVVPRLIETWKSLGPDSRRRASGLLIFRRQNHELLLDALEQGNLLVGQMNFDLERRRALLFSSNASVRERASAFFNDAGVVTRAEAIEKMRPALALVGDSVRGQKIYRDLCSKCHIIGREGSEVGPVLTDIFRKSAETLLHDILDPNAAVDTQYIGYTIVTKNGETLSGLMHHQSPTSVTLREGGGKDTVIARSDIKEMFASGLSLMPEELETDMQPQAMADLLAFLQQPR